MGRISLIRNYEPNIISVARIATACAESEGITQEASKENLFKGIYLHDNHCFAGWPTLPPAASYRILLADISSEQDMRQCVNHHAEGTHSCDHAESQQVLWAVLFRE